MARSSVGGTRGFLRGRVANDIYQVTTNSRGRKVQLVRAAEETREYSNSVEQALARMKMACCMRALAQLKAIVDHSWEGIPYGQNSIANFVKINMPYINWDVYCNWSADSCFCLPKRGEVKYLCGAYQISSGTLPEPTFVVCDNVAGSAGRTLFRIFLSKASPTFADLKAVMGLNADDYITMLLQAGIFFPSSGLANPALIYSRMYLSHDTPDDFDITSENISQCFYFEGNTKQSISFDALSSTITISVSVSPDGIARNGVSYAIIASRWDGVLWRRNNARFHSDDGAFQTDFYEGQGRYAFASWFDEWDSDEGWAQFPANEYPSNAPDNWKAVPDAVADRPILL